MRRGRVAATGVVLLVAAALSSAGHAIVGGEADAADPAVVVLDIGGFRFCSGALIGTHTVLTAGHCMLDASLPLGVSFVGDDGTTATTSLGVVERVRHPGFTQEGAPYDVALLRLDADAGIAPLLLSTHALHDDDVGTTLRHVGFGINDEEAGSGRGSKRSVALPVTSLDVHFVYGGDDAHQTCDGDSGGPALHLDDDGVERIIAITSDGPSCHEIGWDVRIDDVRAFIDDTRARFEPAQAPTRPTGCASVQESDLGIGIALLAPLACSARWRRDRRRHSMTASTHFALL